MEGVREMIDTKKYIVDGVVEREKIAMDIKYRVISKQDIISLMNVPAIRAAFFGEGYSDKKPQSSWNKEYVDKLSYAVVSEAFNEEYLLYLDDVSEYVANKENGIFNSIVRFVKKYPVVAGIIGIVIIGLAVFAYFKMIR